MEGQIISFLEKHSYTEKELSGFLKFDAHEILNKLVKEGKIIFYKRQYYLPSKLKAFKAKIISVKENYAFAKIDGQEEDVYIDGNDLHGAFKDDEVFIKKIFSHGEASYEVLSILKRGRKNVVGVVRILKGLFLLDVEDISVKGHDFIIKSSPVALIPRSSVVLARIIESHDNYSYVEVVELLGSKNDPNINIKRIILSYDASVEFPHDVLEQVKNIPTIVSKEEIEERTSFLDHVIVTIDGEDAKDFDDAVEVIKDEEKKVYHVGVHIADVSHYVTYNSPLDKEAMERSTSLYCVDKVVPMLPFELSNGICSLNPNEIRLVQSVLFDIDFNGNVISYSLHKGVIKSTYRLTYTYVNEVLNANKINDQIPESVNKMISLLNEVALLIRKKRNAKGALELTTTELQFIIASDGQIAGVKKRKQDKGELLIEDLMIQANEIVTIMARERNIPFLYRIHESPKLKRIEEFICLSKILGYPCTFDAFSVTPSALQKHLINIKEKEKKSILSYYLLRSLAKARYSNIHKSHFGLALDNYTHFTSPIRRYPDLLVHRILDYYFFNIGDRLEMKNLENDLFFYSESTSSKERRAQDIERKVDDLYSCIYMKKFIGNIFEVVVTAIVNYGMYVELDSGIEGYVPFEYANEHFIYNENTFTAYSNKGTKFKLGDRINVILVSCNEDKTQIVFSLPSNEKKHTIKIERKKGKKYDRKRKTHFK